MKKALQLLDKKLQSEGFVPGKDYEFVANSHDEWQIECLKKHAEVIGNHAVQAIRDAGEYFNFKCALDAQFQVGRTWAETH